MPRTAVFQVRFDCIREKLSRRSGSTTVEGVQHPTFGAIPILRLHRVIDTLAIGAAVAPDGALALDVSSSVRRPGAVLAVSSIELQIHHTVSSVPRLATISGDSLLLRLLTY